MGITDSLSNDMKRLFDLGGYGIVFGWIIHSLPTFTLALTAIWMSTRVYEYGKQKVLKFIAKRKGIEYKEEQISG